MKLVFVSTISVHVKSSLNIDLPIIVINSKTSHFGNFLKKITVVKRPTTLPTYPL